MCRKILTVAWLLALLTPCKVAQADWRGWCEWAMAQASSVPVVRRFVRSGGEAATASDRHRQANDGVAQAWEDLFATLDNDGAQMLQRLERGSLPGSSPRQELNAAMATEDGPAWVRELGLEMAGPGAREAAVSTLKKRLDETLPTLRPDQRARLLGALVHESDERLQYPPPDGSPFMAVPYTRNEAERFFKAVHEEAIKRLSEMNSLEGYTSLALRLSGDERASHIEPVTKALLSGDRTKVAAALKSAIAEMESENEHYQKILSQYDVGGVYPPETMQLISRSLEARNNNHRGIERAKRLLAQIGGNPPAAKPAVAEAIPAYLRDQERILGKTANSDRAREVLNGFSYYNERDGRTHALYSSVGFPFDAKWDVTFNEGWGRVRSLSLRYRLKPSYQVGTSEITPAVDLVPAKVEYAIARARQVTGDQAFQPKVDYRKGEGASSLEVTNIPPTKAGYEFIKILRDIELHDQAALATLPKQPATLEAKERGQLAGQTPEDVARLRENLGQSQAYSITVPSLGEFALNLGKQGNGNSPPTAYYPKVKIRVTSAAQAKWLTEEVARRYNVRIKELQANPTLLRVSDGDASRNRLLVGSPVDAEVNYGPQGMSLTLVPNSVGDGSSALLRALGDLQLREIR